MLNKFKDSGFGEEDLKKHRQFDNFPDFSLESFSGCIVVVLFTKVKLFRKGIAKSLPVNDLRSMVGH